LGEEEEKKRKERKQVVEAGNTNLRGRLSMFDLLIKIACFDKKVKIFLL
jgi:hypothetical protein